MCLDHVVCMRSFAIVTLGVPGTYEETVALLTNLTSLDTKSPVLHQRLQQPGESIRSYVTNLKDMARMCEYGPLHGHISRDQFIEGTSCEKTRERLLLEADYLSLDRTVDIVL